MQRRTRGGEPRKPTRLLTDLVLRDAMALALLIALQEAIDIAYHVVSDEGWGVPDSHAAAFDLLAEHAVIHPELASNLSSAARVRNRIAHGYASVVHARLWHEVPEGLSARDAFAQAIAVWLPAKPASP